MQHCTRSPGARTQRISGQSGERADRGALQFGDRPPGAQAHLECALNALAVAGTDAGRGLRVAPRELRVQRRPAQAPRLLIELLPQRR